MRELKLHFTQPHQSSELPYSDYLIHGENLSICLIVSPNGQILRFIFNTKIESYLPLLSYLTEKLPNMHIEELRGEFFESTEKIFFSEAPIGKINLVFELLKALHDKHHGYKFYYSSFDKLLCRCFGVYEKDILRIIKNEPGLNFSQLQAKLPMSLACRECESGIKEFLQSHSFQEVSDPLICRCFQVKESTIKNWIKLNPAATFEDLKDDLNAGSECGSCKNDIRQMMTPQKSNLKTRRFKDMTNAEWLVKIQEVLDFHWKSYEVLSLFNLKVNSFAEGIVMIDLTPKPGGDQEWELSELINGLIRQDLDPDLRANFLTISSSI